jgi:folate-binding protein YgfZ
MPEKPFYTTLENRGLIRISGADRESFVQGLITNDINLLKTQNLLYACLLSAQGKFLHDLFIARDGESLLMDCEGGQRAADLARRLSMYKLRAAVSIETLPDQSIYAIFGTSDLGAPDPRHPDMGYRSFEKPENLVQKPFEDWDKLRISLSIPDGSRDLIPEKSTLDEGRIDQLNGVDYTKGCYVGQELTARMHYRGLGKKHLYAVQGTLPAPGAEIVQDGKSIGEMRSSCGAIGLALLKDEAASNLTIFKRL